MEQIRQSPELTKLAVSRDQSVTMAFLSVMFTVSFLLNPLFCSTPSCQIHKDSGSGWCMSMSQQSIYARSSLTLFMAGFIAVPHRYPALFPCLPLVAFAFFFCFSLVHFRCTFLSSLPESDAYSQKTFWAVPWAQPLVQVPHHRQV